MHSQQADIVALFQFQHLIKKDVVSAAAKAGRRKLGAAQPLPPPAIPNFTGLVKG